MQDLKVSVARIEVTVDNLARSFARLEQLIDKVNGHSSRLDTHEVRLEDHGKRLKELEDGKNWVIKTVAGIIIAALLGLIIAKTGVPFVGK